jgi:hypothetical protein
MTELMVVETGEVVVQMTAEEASSITTQISVKLDALADNYESVMPLIRDAITRQAHAALGYNSPGAYVAERFGRALSRLGGHLRREVSRELSEAGLSTRAIAPVVGVSHMTVARDVASGVTDVTPDPVDAELVDDESENESVRVPAGVHIPATPDDAPLTQEQCEELDAGSRPEEERQPAPVIGLDGRRYARPVPKPATSKPRTKPITDTAKNKGFELRSNALAIKKLLEDPRYPTNEKQVALALRGHLLYVAETVAAVLDQLP